MSVTAKCDRCEEESPFMSEDYTKGSHCYRLPSGWVRPSEVSDWDEWQHLCPKCAAELRKAAS